jgi:hypothetical protein
MPTQHRPKSVKTESHMSQAVARDLGKYAAREVKVGDCKFDVVAYNKEEKLFRLVECKKTNKASGIGHAFGQVAAYHATIATHGVQFLDAYSKKIPNPMRLTRWMEATDNYRRIRIAFSVALTEEACQRIDLLSAMKKLLPDVGIIRVKPDGRCRPYVRVGKDKDDKLTKARPVVIEILQPAE